MAAHISKDKRNEFHRRVFELTVNSHIEHFTYYLDKVEAEFKIDKAKTHKQLKELCVGLSEDEVAQLEYEYSDEFYLIDDVFVPIFYASSTMSLFSFFESEMISLCKQLDRTVSPDQSFATIGGKGLEKAKEYLTNQIGIDISDLNTLWSPLKNMASVRNCLAHANGDIAQMKCGEKEKLQKIIASTNGLSLAHETEIRIEKGYLIDRAADISRFLLQVQARAYS